MFHWTLHLKRGLKENCHDAVVVGQKLYSFGGIENYNYNNNSDQIQVHIFNTVSLRWSTLPPVTNGGGQSPIEVPSGRYGHTAELVEEIVYIWGGVCNVLYAFNVDTHSWFKPRISGLLPEARKFHSACVLEKVMYVFGGCTVQGQMDEITNDIYKLDTRTMVWAFINTRGTPPPASWCHSATIIGTKMFVFGGMGEGGYQRYFHNSIRGFDTETNCWMNTHSAQLLPEARSSHSAFAFNGELYVFGGWKGLGLGLSTAKQYFNDLWKFSPETFSWKQVETKGKDPCGMRLMRCCMVGDCIIIFGGYTAHYSMSDDLYILDLSPSLKTLCKLAVTQHGLDESELPHDIRWELVTMTTNSNTTQ